MYPGTSAYLILLIVRYRKSRTSARNMPLSSFSFVPSFYYFDVISCPKYFYIRVPYCCSENQFCMKYMTKFSDLLAPLEILPADLYASESSDPYLILTDPDADPDPYQNLQQ